MNTEAAILEKQGEPLRLEALRFDPNELLPGKVVVQMHYASICGAQVGEVMGSKGPDRFLPHLLGHEGVGTVVYVSAGVRTVDRGDLVVLHWRKGAGINCEASPRFYRKDGTLVGAGPVTSFASVVVVSEDRVTRAPSARLHKRFLPLFGCAITTGFGIVCNEAKVRIGESILVLGAGGIGQSVVTAARAAGALPIYAVDFNEGSLRLAHRFGADECSASITELPPNLLFDHVVETTGCCDVIDLGLCRVKPGGKMILAGQPRAGDCLSITNARQHYVGKTILDSQGGLTDPAKDIPRLISFFHRRGLHHVLSQMITGVWQLTDINHAFSHILNGKAVGRCLIEMA